MNPVTHSDVPAHKGCNPGTKHPCVMYCEAQLQAVADKATQEEREGCCKLICFDCRNTPDKPAIFSKGEWVHRFIGRDYPCGAAKIREFDQKEKAERSK